MPYIGKEPTTGNFVYADDITASATNTYNILVGGVAFSPESANHLIVSLNGVIQKANTSFSVSGSQITFLPSSGTLSSSDSIDFILILGSVNAVGVATTVSDSAITKGKLNLISDSSSAGLTVKGDGSSENGTLQLNCSQNSHGVKISSPAHSAGQSYELILPTGNVTADKFLKVASVSGSGATGIGQLSFGDVSSDAGTLSFQANINGNLSVSATTQTELVYNAEVTDSDSKFNVSTGRYTPGVAGTYFVSASVTFAPSGNTGYSHGGYLKIRKNGTGTEYGQNSNQGNNSGADQAWNANAVITLGSSDYISVWWYHTEQSGSMLSDQCWFSGFRIA